MVRRIVLLAAVCALLTGCPRPVPLDAPPAQEFPVYRYAKWSDLPGWMEDDPTEALDAFIKGCRALKSRAAWQQICADARQVPPVPSIVRAFFETRFQPWQLQETDGVREGTITGYYGPELLGSRQKTERFSYPLYRWPQDMLVVDLSEVYPELKSFRLRGRIDGRKLVPYWTRGEIDAKPDRLNGEELVWLKDPVELFFLHIQGSGRVALTDGTKIMVGYENQNGHPYRSIGKLLIDRGMMTRDQMSMQNIRAWARRNPDLVWDLLAENPSYVFFRELPPRFQTPPGSLGIALTPERSIAVDRRTVPLGVPVYLATRRPDEDIPLQRLMVAQDTGGAIKGRVRADFFWGMGYEAGTLAGRMKYPGRMWVLLPVGIDPVQAGSIEAIDRLR